MYSTFGKTRFRTVDFKRLPAYFYVILNSILNNYRSKIQRLTRKYKILNSISKGSSPQTRQKKLCRIFQMILNTFSFRFCRGYRLNHRIFERPFENGSALSIQLNLLPRRLEWQQLLSKLECIPVGCVPSARSGSRPGGDAWSRGGVCSQGGAWSWGGPGPKGGGLVPGGLCSQGGCLVPGGGIPACTEADPPVNRMTDRCKNITFATSLRTVIIKYPY